MLRRVAISERAGSNTTTYPLQSEETGAEGCIVHWSIPSDRIKLHSLHAKGFFGTPFTLLNFDPRESIRGYLVRIVCMSDRSWNDVDQKCRVKEKQYVL